VAERIGGLLHGEFAPYEQRLAALTALLNAIPRLLEQYRVNLKNPPRLYTEFAIKDNAGRIALCKNEVAAFVARGRSAPATRAAQAALQSALTALAAFQTFLEKDLLPAPGETGASAPSATPRSSRWRYPPPSLRRRR